jgi:hypothetical protein
MAGVYTVAAPVACNALVSGRQGQALVTCIALVSGRQGRAPVYMASARERRVAVLAG